MYNNPPCSAGGRKLFRSWASSSRVRFWWRRPPRSGCSQNPSPCRKNCACSRRTEVGRHPKAWPTWLAFSPSAARSHTHCTRWNSALLRAPRKACANRSTEPSGKDRGGRIAPSIKVSQEGVYISIYMNATWYQYRREINPEGKVHHRKHAVAMPDWRVSLQDHHPGYIRWEEFLHNQERLEKNRTNGEETVLAGPAREGLALLQGLLLCGHCGRRLTVRYTGNGGIYPRYQCNWLRRESLASKDCLNLRCDLLDAAVAEEVLKALQPAELELALAALAELESRDQALLRQWQMRIERAEYEAALAERRYLEVDPSQRLVVSTLERRWNDALLQLEDLKKQAAEFRRQEARVATPEQKAKVLALAQDLPRVWHAPTTQAKDRKRMLRLLLKDITVEKPSSAKQLLVHLRWQGGASTNLTVQLPLNIADRVRYPTALVDRVRELAHGLPDAEIANQFHREGHASAKGKPYTTRIVRWIRWRYQIPPATLRRPEELTVQQVAQDRKSTR